jgi:hypothetical protein
MNLTETEKKLLTAFIGYPDCEEEFDDWRVVGKCYGRLCQNVGVVAATELLRENIDMHRNVSVSVYRACLAHIEWRK